MLVRVLPGPVTLCTCVISSPKCPQGDPLQSCNVFLSSTNFSWNVDSRGLRKDFFCGGSEHLINFLALMSLPALFSSSSSSALVFPSLTGNPPGAIHTDLCILQHFPLSQGLTFLTFPKCLGIFVLHSLPHFPPLQVCF